MRTSERNDAIADLRAALAMLYCLEQRDAAAEQMAVTADQTISDVTLVAGLAAERVKRVMAALEDDSSHGDTLATG